MGQGTESCGGYEIEYDPYEEGLCDGMWQQSDYSSIHVSKMSVKHIRNSIKLCENMRNTSNFSCDEDKWDEWIDIFESELYSRGEPRYELKTPVHYDTPEKVKSTRGSKIELVCHCGNKYSPRVSDLKRGWGKSCCKKCASIKREFGRRDPVGIDGKSYKRIIEELKGNNND